MVEHLSKRFGSRVAFDGVSFQVGYGDVFGFLGPNGAGKTTTLRTLGTLIAPTSRSRRRIRGGEAAMSFSWARVGAILQKELRDYRRNRFVVLTMSILPLIFIAAPMVQLFSIKVSIASAKLDTRIGISLLYMFPAVASAVFERPHLLVQLLFTPLVAGWSIWVGIAVSTRVGDVRAAQRLAILASLPPVVIVALFSFNVITPSLGIAVGLAAALLLIDGLAWRVVATMFDGERLVTGARS